MEKQFCFYFSKHSEVELLPIFCDHLGIESLFFFLFISGNMYGNRTSYWTAEYLSGTGLNTLNVCVIRGERDNSMGGRIVCGVCSVSVYVGV